jgi:nicotinamidase-related amidase
MNSTGQYSRRNFLVSLNAITAMGLINFPTAAAQEGPRLLHIKPRYHRWHVDPGVEWLETNTGYATLDWTIPLSQTALVLVDVWQRHYLKDTEERAEKIIQKNLVPLVDACRKEGMKVIHAPSSHVARQHPNWVKLVRPDEPLTKRDNWPPEDFKHLAGEYKGYSRPHEPREAERQSLPELTFHPQIVPVSDEAVVANGEELHRYCKQNGILFLFFAGFNTNACILSRDYGTIQMSNRGYQVILVRDCTTGMETRDTQPTMSQTQGAILLLEMFGQHSITSEELIAGFN